jgi:predicted MFS family arabinose efflux permease
MKSISESASQPPGFAVLLGVLLAGQTVGTMASMMLPAVAPKVAETFGVDASLIGYQISLLAAAMLVSLVFGSNLSTRWGACRVTQAGLGLMSGGCLLATAPHIGFLFLSAIGLGLGYGLLTPAASHLLMRFTPAGKRNLIFSLKQSGVPLGGIFAALITPAVAVAIGWQWALAGNALLLLLLVFLLQQARSWWDDDRQPAARFILNPFGGIATVWNHPALRLLSIAGGCFVIVQICVSTFTVVLFAEEMHVGLIQAGLVLTASQVGGVTGRIFWGWLADVTRNCFVALALLALVMLATCLMVIAITPGWPVLVSSVLFFVIGSTASGWNGAFLAEVARLSPQDAISRATGGSLVFVNAGKMMGPILFANAYLLGGSYTLAFGLLALPAAAGLACLVAVYYGEAHATASP